MQKKEIKQIFTEDLEKYVAFLETTNQSLADAITEMENQEKIRKILIQIIRQYQKKHSLSIAKLQNVIKCSCPDYSAISMLTDLGIQHNIESLMNLAEESNDFDLIDCSNRNCQECWKQYINFMARALNNSPVDVKTIELNPEDE
jgi:hypothetical protein